MGLFEQPIVESKEVMIGSNKILLSPPTAFDYSEYIRRLTATINALPKDEVKTSNEDEVGFDTVRYLTIEDSNNAIIVLQLAACMISHRRDLGWDGLVKELTENYHAKKFEKAVDAVFEIFKIRESMDAEDSEKKPSTRT